MENGVIFRDGLSTKDMSSSLLNFYVISHQIDTKGQTTAVFSFSVVIFSTLSENILALTVGIQRGCSNLLAMIYWSLHE